MGVTRGQWTDGGTVEGSVRGSGGEISRTVQPGWQPGAGGVGVGSEDHASLMVLST